MKDFFISYNRADQQWAEWIAWTLEEAGYSVVIQAWDFRPGGNFAIDMQNAAAETQKTIAVLSESYLKSAYTQPEWATAFADDPQSQNRKLIPIRVGQCQPDGMLRPIVYVDLVGRSEAEATRAVLDAMRDRVKPEQKPAFPGELPQEPVVSAPVAFPGAASTSTLSPSEQVKAEQLNNLTTDYRATTQQLNQATSEGESAQLQGRLENLKQEMHQVEADLRETPIRLQPFFFETATLLKKQETGFFGKKIEWTIAKTTLEASQLVEDLGGGVRLAMVAIPAGAFVMGSPNSEPERHSNESPQHRVQVNALLMGKHPITQAQWRAVAALSKVNRELDADPTIFKGDNRPVECVTWLDAVEFCDRLTQATGRNYRLPSEAEWEYACRAGTTTPFHFGETITTEVANYDGNYVYGSGSKGVYRKKTTPVGSFGVANAFGLFDMHGNVLEWCLDHWHSDYEGAPQDGRAWLINKNANEKRVLRGGSWSALPRVCRSASRYDFDADYRDIGIGFRVVCGSAWTL